MAPNHSKTHLKGLIFCILDEERLGRGSTFALCKTFLQNAISNGKDAKGGFYFFSTLYIRFRHFQLSSFTPT
jgi:hypothetical protein